MLGQWPVSADLSAAIMRAMYILRTSSLLARLVLAWFVLTLGVAIASPIVHPQSMQVICSDGGSMKLVATGDDEAAQGVHHTLDCPLCLATTLPAPPASRRVAEPQPMAHALHPFATAHIAALLGAPLPPRGPPTLS